MASAAPLASATSLLSALPRALLAHLFRPPTACCRRSYRHGLRGGCRHAVRLLCHRRRPGEKGDGRAVAPFGMAFAVVGRPRKLQEEPFCCAVRQNLQRLASAFRVPVCVQWPEDGAHRAGGLGGRHQLSVDQAGARRRALPGEGVDERCMCCAVLCGRMSRAAASPAVGSVAVLAPRPQLPLPHTTPMHTLCVHCCRPSRTWTTASSSLCLRRCTNATCCCATRHTSPARCQS